MNNKNLHLGVIIVVCIFTSIAFSCKKDDKEKPEPDIPRPVKEIAGVLEGRTILFEDTVYLLNYFVRVPDGSILTIQPGTTIFGDRLSKGTLIIERGAKIYADGTLEKPIIFTSLRGPGERQPGDWGGLVLCGKARNNQSENTEIAGGFRAVYGGNDDEDNSGILRYVRIDFAGAPIVPGEEFDALTLASVGSKTTIENIQTSYSLGDGFAIYGGNVNAKNLISYHNLDDDFDMDLGYSGKIQFGLAIRKNNLADQSGSNGIEAGNNISGSLETPYTAPVLSNFTLIGPKRIKDEAISSQFQHAIHLRKNCRVSVYNSFATAFPHGLYIDDAKSGSGQAALNGELQVRNLILAGVEGWGGNGYGKVYNQFRDKGTGIPFMDGDVPLGNHSNMPRGAALRWHQNFPGSDSNSDNPESIQPMVSWFETATFNNSFLSKWEDAGIDNSVFNSVNPKLIPNIGSLLLNAARWDNTPKADSFFEQVNYIGAFGSKDWTESWVDWDPQQTVYE